MKRYIKVGSAKKVIYTTAMAVGLSAGAYGIASASTNTTLASSTSSTGATVAASAQTSPSQPWAFGGRGPGGPMMRGLAGTVASITSNGFTLTSQAGTTNVITSSTTTYDEAGTTVHPTSVTVGETVSVMPVFAAGQVPNASSTSVTAGAVYIEVPTLAGKVISADSSSIVIQDREGFYRTIDLSGSTTYSVGGGTSTGNDTVTVGQQVVAYGSIATDHTQLNATSIDVMLPRYEGTISNLTATGFTLTDPSGTAYTVTVNTSTTYRAMGSTTASLSRLTSGSQVMVEGTLSGTDITATEVGLAPNVRSDGPGAFLPGAGGGQPLQNQATTA